MRIIAGEFGGRVLKAPKGRTTRPTTDRVRESMMSALSSARGGFDGAVVLDAFAGSGALAFEALSRGAACAHLFERDRGALAALSANAEALGVAGKCARIHRCDVFKNPPTAVRPPFDLVLLDPPYAYGAAEVLGLVALLAREGALTPGAAVMYEHDAASNDDVDAAATPCGLALATRKQYGDTVVDIFSLDQRP